jgi:DNA-binding transcriptional ArsR family regulator
MKGQDLLLLLKLVSLSRREASPFAAADWAELAGTFAPEAVWEQLDAGQDPYSVRALEDSTGISKSEVSGGLRRCMDAGLLKPGRESGKPQVNTRGLYELLAYGVRYFFPALPGPLVRGLPTAHAAPVLKDRLLSAGEHIHVWEDAEGTQLGQRVEPLFRTVPKAARRDPGLYAMLALVDSIRLGQAREAGLARELLEKMLRGKGE